ncbi:hypothetical protein Agabi119p4_1125 [Agaricus bisporus var. burnettii]|uniref:Uncharacterized protein n=1 Tax=Agaricus bisporus var. burnettii TaxID=192524 RepID=A0A8H7KLE1_AGABI|nr:hypothetical protein Agabi119p4_1125 [Agaricus bisporus var. burnettii]
MSAEQLLENLKAVKVIPKLMPEIVQKIQDLFSFGIFYKSDQGSLPDMPVTKSGEYVNSGSLEFEIILF